MKEEGSDVHLPQRPQKALAYFVFISFVFLFLGVSQQAASKTRGI
jgi:hypothetical protein